MGESTSTKEEDSNKHRNMINFTWERIQSITIVILVIVILLMQQCNGKKSEPVETKVVTVTETVWDTLEVEKKVYVPKWRTKILKETDTVEVIVQQEVDTVSILKDYYTKYVYNDTLFLDSLGYISLTDTITQNKIITRNPNYHIQIPTKTLKETIYVNNREFYAGFGARTNGSSINWMGLEGLYRNKKGNIFTIGLGTDTENKLSVGGSIHWRIGGE